MSNTWKGPSAAILASYSDRRVSRLHRKAGEHSVFYDINNSGTEAHVYRLERQGGQWRSVSLGLVRGGDPVNTTIHVALQHTPHDPELLGLIGSLIADRLASLTAEVQKQINAVIGTADVLAQTLAPVRSRYV